MDLIRLNGQRVARFLRRFARDERGQATTEYVLLLSFALVTAVFIGRKLLGSINNGILRFNGQLEKDLKTGRMPLIVWRN